MNGIIKTKNNNFLFNIILFILILINKLFNKILGARGKLKIK